jgi:ABC-2 type transport system ATP-binding protein
MSDETAIKVEHVSKTFKLPLEKASSIKSAAINFYKKKRKFEQQEALKDISFEVKKGEFFGIVGRNGSGKSTLLKLLAGIYIPTQGSITVNGKLIPFIELGVGFSPELSGRENVYLNGALLGFSRKEMDKMYHDIVDFAEIERFMDQKLKNYSSGMQVRLAFSIAIRAKGDILLLDEVLAVGDAAFQQKCFNYFEELKQQKRTVVFVTHDMGAVRRFCSRAVYINDGLLIHDGTPAEVADLYTVANVENMRDEKVIKDKAQKRNAYKITSKIMQQTADKVVLGIAYEAKPNEEVYVAMSVILGGMSVAEITTPLEMKLTGKGEITYTLDITVFNGGVYEVPVILCRRRNRELLVISESKNRFVIKGNDITKGSALRLKDAWGKQTSN